VSFKDARHVLKMTLFTVYSDKRVNVTVYLLIRLLIRKQLLKQVVEEGLNGRVVSEE